MQILRDAGMAGMSKSDFTRRTQFMDHRQRDGVLRTLAEAGLIEMTISDKPRSSKQQYRLTEKGKLLQTTLDPGEGE
jgi:ATP-dependent DNA helicase RecG